jgi:hypothetical protein
MFLLLNQTHQPVQHISPAQLGQRFVSNIYIYYLQHPRKMAGGVIHILSISSPPHLLYPV